MDSFIWTVNPELVNVFGISIRWYGLFFALAFVIGQQIMFKVYKSEGFDTKYVEELTIFMIVATVLGARLGHVFFYEPARYLSDPLEILNLRGGGLASHGAAVGLFIGMWVYINYTIKLKIFPPKLTIRKIKKEGQSWMWLADRLVLVVALAGALIRTGNFMNSEIIGKPTDSEHGVVFARNVIDYLESGEKAIEEVKVYRDHRGEKRNTEDNQGLVPAIIEVKLVKGDYPEDQVELYFQQNVKMALNRYSAIRDHIKLYDEDQLEIELYQKQGQYHAKIAVLGVNRHPAQLYEAMSSLLLFFILFGIWQLKKAHLPRGMLFGIFLTWIFGLRFLYEFLKENQVAFEDNLPLNMGQWLSIPLVIAGLFILLRSIKQGAPSQGTGS